jgi:hypothetical protein
MEPWHGILIHNPKRLKYARFRSALSCGCPKPVREVYRDERAQLLQIAFLKLFPQQAGIGGQETPIAYLSAPVAGGFTFKEPGIFRGVSFQLEFKGSPWTWVIGDFDHGVLLVYAGTICVRSHS